MADVVISYAPENEATARQLGEKLSQQGYDIWGPPAGSSAANADEVTEHVVAAKAVVVVWSSAAAASEWVRAEANVARGLKKLVQASADGSSPPIPFDPAQVASISTWLGDDAHPGWEAILTGVAALAGAPAPAPETAAPEAAAVAPPPEPEPVAAPPEPEPVAAPPEPEPEPIEPTVVPVSPAEPEQAPPPTEPIPPAPAPEALSDPAPGALSDPAPAVAAAAAGATAAAAPSRRGPSLGLILIILFVLIVLAAAGYVFWQRSQLPAAAPVSAETNSIAPPAPSGPDVPQDVPLEPGAEVAPPPANETFDRQATLRGGGPAAVRSAPSAQGFTVGQIQTGEAFQTYPQAGEWWRVRTASGVTGYVMASAIALQDPSEAGPQAQVTTPGQPQTRTTTTRRPEPPRPPRQRIRKENSEVMEAFCANSGRNTPQCRRFRQSY